MSSFRCLLRLRRYFTSGGGASTRVSFNAGDKEFNNIAELFKDKKNLWLLAIPITTFCLGTWQVLRLQRKLQLVEELEKRTMMPSITMPNDISERLDELNYRKVTLTGHFDHSREIHMWPRKQHDPLPLQAEELGALIITPFHCNETGSRILVNRGWVPSSRVDPADRPYGQVEGEVTLKAIVRTQDKKPIFSPWNDAIVNKWAWRDVSAMARHLGTEPIFLDADSSTTVHGGPIGGQTEVTVPNENLQYIVIWHSMSLATFYVFWRFWRKGGR